MAYPFFTIGHGRRPLSEFVDRLREAEVTLVADVRTVPRSRTNPQYDRDVLPHALAPSRIAYEHIAALGGLRGKTRDVPPKLNAFWQNKSFHNYADYAIGDEFHAGFSRLLELGLARRCAIMCAETLWWRCHRRIITDYLIAAGETVFHILGTNHIMPAHVTPAAKLGPSGTLCYPAVDGERTFGRSSRPV
jgi:uncharacterized protein (DUF488 family)